MTEEIAKRAARPLKVLIAGGGTGGHVFPALAVANELTRRGHEVTFAGSKRGLEAEVVPESGYELDLLNVEGLAARSLFAKLRSLGKLSFAILGARRILRRRRPNVVLGVGGYASGAIVVGAWTRGVPVVLHEQNVTLGMTNRQALRFARAVAVSFKQTAEFVGKKAVVTGNPARKQFFEVPPAASTPALKILVFGGSQGSRILNQAVIEALPLLKDHARPPLLVHQTGPKWVEEVQEGYREAGYTGAVVPFIKDMAGSMTESDLIVCRAGATTVAELAAAGRGAILVPFAQAAGDHQTFNAELVEKAGAGVVLPEAKLTGRELYLKLEPYLDVPILATRLGQRARTLARSDAAERIADLIEASAK